MARLLALLLAAALLAQGASAEPVAFDRAQFGQVVLSRPQSGGVELEVATGAYRNESIRNYAPDSVLAEMGRAVGRLDVLTDIGVFPCTAFVVSRRHVLTNHHCVPGLPQISGAGRVEAISLVMGYVEEGVVEGTRSFQVAPVPVEADAGLDYAVLEVFGDPASRFGVLPLSARAPSEGDPFWVIGHPLGEAQRISREGCRAGRPAVSDGRLLHGCDTLPGNSGSPVIDASGRGVVGLHHAGSRRNSVNFAIPMARILGASDVLQESAGAARTPAAGAETRLCEALHAEASDRGDCRSLEIFVSHCEGHPRAASARRDVRTGACGRTAEAARTPPQPERFEILSATDLPGGDIDEVGIRGVSLSDCEASCRTEPSCASFTYVVAKDWCWLKSRTNAAVAAPGLVSGIRRDEVVAARSAQHPGFDRLGGTDLSGGDLTPDGIRDVSLARCEAICRTSAACTAYSYVTAKRWCWPKAGAPVRVRVSGIVSGIVR